MKKGTVLKKKGLALLLSFFLGFGALSCGIEMRALAEESGTSPETGGDSETTPLLEDTITLSSLTKELVYTGDSLSGEFSATAVSGRKPVFSFYKGKTVSGDPVTPIDAGDYTAVIPNDLHDKKGIHQVRCDRSYHGGEIYRLRDHPHPGCNLQREDPYKGYRLYLIL